MLPKSLIVLEPVHLETEQEALMTTNYPTKRNISAQLVHILLCMGF